LRHRVIRLTLPRNRRGLEMPLRPYGLILDSQFFWPGGWFRRSWTKIATITPCDRRIHQKTAKNSVCEVKRKWQMLR
ncbi:hypothetical protein, partial [Parasphingorhabdus sp.]|uniref:hypothetical protein n=1 Tax=Parasphingorhabdus sp. TaxID=2709688 RepID=UPI003A90EEDD